MPLPEVSDEQLLVLLFGPGIGELILVRAPGDKWLVVDGCRKQGRTWYAQRTLEHYGASPAIIVLTHPHRDHAGGVAEVVEDATDSESDDWPLLGMCPPPEPSPDVPAHAPAAYEAGVAERAVATIDERWRQRPACKWEMEVGDQRMLGSASLTVLSPADRLASDPNRRASALLLEWESTSIVLGADLAPEDEWAPALRATDHHGLKVAHHASLPALHDPLLEGSPDALRLCTPFASQRLPRFDPEGGIQRLHQTGKEVHLTALPRAYRGQGGAGGQRISRGALARQPSALDMDPPVTGFPDCFIAVRWTASGARSVEYGPGSVIVQR